MTEYFVTFFTKISAKSKNDLGRKAEKVAQSMSMCVGKKVEPHGYVEIEKGEQTHE